MKLITLFSARLSVLLTKWAAIGVLWICSVFLVTSSALIMDQFSDWAQRLAGYTTPYAKQKASTKAANKRALKAEKIVKSQRAKVKAHSAKVKKLGGKMVARNAADATTSMIPVIGGAASVGFAVWDVYAACELITAQKRFELLMGTATAADYTTLEATCVSTTATVEATGREAKRFIAATDQAIDDMPDLPDVLADQMCKITGNC